MGNFFPQSSLTWVNLTKSPKIKVVEAWFKYKINLSLVNHFPLNKGGGAGNHY
jgi:hypothetical protein